MTFSLCQILYRLAKSTKSLLLNEHMICFLSVDLRLDETLLLLDEHLLHLFNRLIANHLNSRPTFKVDGHASITVDKTLAQSSAMECVVNLFLNLIRLDFGAIRNSEQVAALTSGSQLGHRLLSNNLEQKWLRAGGG